MPERPRTPVLFVHHRSELGGAPASLSYLIRELDERFPLFFKRHEFRPDSAGDGRFRGGVGSVLELRMETTEPALGNTAGDGVRYPAYGVLGGKDGLPHRYRMIARKLRGPVGTRSVATAFGSRPLKAQLRMADRGGARFAVIVGAEEAATDMVTVRRMEDGVERRGIPFDEAIAFIDKPIVAPP